MVMVTKKLNIKEFLKKNWHIIILLIIIFLLAFSLRSFPARFNELQALDPFYFYRLNEYALNNNFALPSPDYMRHAPYGYNPYSEPFVPNYFPAFFYSMIAFTGMYFHTFALFWPAFLGALAAVLMYFVGKELFNYKAGLIAAFFVAVLPAFITRTSAGFLEKEPHAAVFIMLTMFFFIRSYKKSSWLYGILSGISMFLLLETWGGAQFFIILLAVFVFILLILNQYSDRILKSYIPLAILGVGLTQFVGHDIKLFNLAGAIPIAIVILILIRYIVEKKNLVNKEYIPYIIPALVIFGAVGFVVASFFLESLNTILGNLIQNALLQPGVELSTVAESQPGSVGVITSLTDPHFAASLQSTLNLWIAIVFAGLAAFFAFIRIKYEKIKTNEKIVLIVLIPITWIVTYFLLPYFYVPGLSGNTIPVTFLFLILGVSILALLYELYKTRKWIYIIPIFWFILAVHGALGYVRLSFLIGPPVALLFGYFFALLWERLTSYAKISNATDWKQKFNYITVPLIAVILFAIIINTANGYVYSQGLGPSICFPQANKPCLTIAGDGTLIFDENQPWYQAMGFLATETPENANILSWWDFGYWFQTRGERASVSDGGGGYRYNIALWYTAPVEEWDEFTWLKERGVSHILMDYTLPGKYGAISTIATQRERPVGILQFQPSGSMQQDGMDVLQFSSGPYRIWIPQNGSSVAGTPMFLIQQGDTFSQPNFINDICTNTGIVVTGNRTPDIGGCVALSDIGVHYVPPEAEHNIFTSLMFMDGAGLPVEKVFDNTLVKIFEIKWEEQFSSL